MINNKQINVWRGSKIPPTIYHMWILDDLTIQIHNGTEWIPFITDASLGGQVAEMVDKVTALETEMRDKITALEKHTVNDILITDNPFLDATHLETTIKDGVYIKENDNVAQALKKHDELLRTKYIE